MRVLQVLDYINYSSGVSSVVLNYYYHMDRSQVQCDFLIFECTGNECEEKVRESGAKIYTTMQPTTKNMAKYIKCLDEFFENHSNYYDVIHVHIPVAASMILSKAKKYGIEKRILHSHNARGADGVAKRVRNYFLNKSGIFYANCYLACSEAAGHYLYGKKRRFTVLPNAIDIKKYQFDKEARERIRKKIGVKDELLLGHVGRFVEQKNHEGLLAIFAEVCKNRKDVKLLLIGDGKLKNRIEERAKEYQIEDKIIFEGVVENVNEYMSAMDVFLLPSLYEGLPVVCVEAQMAGLPCVISTNVTREIKMTSNVSFIENDDIEAWKRNICTILDNDIDRGKLHIEAYDIAIQAKKLEEYYLQNGTCSNTNVNL